jgi:sigma-B regulation protein RsbU (phosphoserine phosphatase)
VSADGAVEARGVKLTREDLVSMRERVPDLRDHERERMAGDLPPGPLRELFERLGFDLLVPLRHGDATQGTLLVGHKASGKPLSEEDVEFLRSLAAQAAAALDNLRLRREWLEKQRIEKELALAREIQRALLPDRDPTLTGWDLAGVNIPCLTVGGDYYDYLPGPNGMIGLTIADVSGKGTGPALLMAAVQASLRALSGLGELSLEDIVSRLNELVYRSSGASKYVTVFLGWLHPGTGKLVFSNAGHCYPLILRANGEVDRLVTGAPVIGLLPEVEVETAKTTLERGDMLVAYTDGLSETTNAEGEEYQEARIIEAARAARELTARDVVGRLVSEVRIFAAEAGLKDDLTLMVVKRL